MKPHHGIEEYVFNQIEELLANGATYAEVVKKVGLGRPTVVSIARGEHFWQADKKEQERRIGVSHTSTLEEIAEACERIQAERRRNRGGEDNEAGWTPPVIRRRDLMGV